MYDYIGSDAQQIALSAIVSPSEQELRMALNALNVSPVPTYPGFSLDEVRVLAAYRCQHRNGASDIVWQGIASGSPEAWLYAIHEAAEIEAFVVIGIDFLQREAWERHLPQAHISACIAEDRFLKAWADHLGYNTTEMALEINNPIRKQYLSHWANVEAIRLASGWEEPDEDQEAQAQAFYRKIL